MGANYAVIEGAYLGDILDQPAAILPVQMMSLALAAMAGFEAGAFTVATKVTATE